MIQELNALLVRIPADQPLTLNAGSASLSAAGIPFELEPLFTVQAQGVGLTSSVAQWYIARPTGSSLTGANPWDVAHEMRKSIGASVGLSAQTSPDFIEPDLVQQWPHDTPIIEKGVGAAGDSCRFDDQDQSLPFRKDEFAWHLSDSFSQLGTARAKAEKHSTVVRIAHLDTGYDPNHETFPKGQADLNLQRNFVDDRQSDARDLGNSGLLRSPGHGTGTLSILAGTEFAFAQAGYKFKGMLGGVSQSRLVPIRIGNSVVQLTTSSVAKGIHYAAQLSADKKTRVDVISMSMGGVASAAWADAVNEAYEAGIIFVAAAGNNFSAGKFGFPTHQIVFPARFHRVIAACGVMANREPYYGLRAGTMQGNWGPDSAMTTALSAYTPNISWARWGCSNIVRMNGAGTSSATPQIAAAAALYVQAHGSDLFDARKYSAPWMRVEMVRRALFQSADKRADRGSSEKVGHGLLQSQAALDVSPAAAGTLKKTAADSAGFPFLNVLSKTGMAPSLADRMLQLEATQLIQRWEREDVQNPLEAAINDPDEHVEKIAPAQIRRYLEIVSEHPHASNRLRDRAKEALGSSRRSTTKTRAVTDARIDARSPASSGASFVPPSPPFRKLRGYAVDPSLATALDTVAVSEVTFKIPWEKVSPGPIGEYLEVVDVDPASKCFYEPVNLDDPILLAQDGLPPAEGIPQFHQQMVYAVCSLTIDNFERALGRKTLWRPRPAAEGEHEKSDLHYVPKLRVYPHALRDANAFFSPQKVSLLFGYFNAINVDPRDQLPGGRVFTCLSHDIIAHETTHALLDGMHRRFLLPTNRDVLAFHEAFADAVALLQHFTFPELLAHQISATRGKIEGQENLLVQMAGQFGHATGRRMALRDMIGHMEKGEWKLRPADPSEYETVGEPHERGRILVAAVFDALLSIYKHRTADLIRLATGGSGILRPGALHPDLVNRLAREASKSAQHVLTMCIRALDYCPPTDITFGEYLRAIITADNDLVADDDLNYRVSFIEAFRRRGIFPPGVRSMSVGSLLWRSPEEENPRPSDAILKHLAELRDSGADYLYAESREDIFKLQRQMRLELHRWLKDHFLNHTDGKTDAEFLGLDFQKPFEVHMARFAYRSRPDGGVAPQLMIGLLQSSTHPVDPQDPTGPTMSFEGGSTVVADLREPRVRYCIRKSMNSPGRLCQQQQFALTEFDSLHATYLGNRPLSGGSKFLDQEPFALLHRGI